MAFYVSFYLRSHLFTHRTSSIEYLHIVLCIEQSRSHRFAYRTSFITSFCVMGIIDHIVFCIQHFRSQFFKNPTSVLCIVHLRFNIFIYCNSNDSNLVLFKFFELEDGVGVRLLLCLVLYHNAAFCSISI